MNLAYLLLTIFAVIYISKISSAFPLNSIEALSDGAGHTIMLLNDNGTDTEETSGNGDTPPNPPGQPNLTNRLKSAVLVNIDQKVNSNGGNAEINGELKATSNAFQYNLRDQSALVHIQNFVPELVYNRNLDMRQKDGATSLNDFVSGLTSAPLSDVIAKLPIGDFDQLLPGTETGLNQNGPKRIEKRSAEKTGGHMADLVGLVERLNDKALTVLGTSFSQDKQRHSDTSGDSPIPIPTAYKTLSSVDSTSLDHYLDHKPTLNTPGMVPIPTPDSSEGGANTINSFRAEGHAQVRQVIVGKVVVNVNVLQFPVPDYGFGKFADKSGGVNEGADDEIE